MSYAPQLATLVKQVPTGPGWLHEVKYDGYRIGCVVRDGRITLLSRRGNDWTAQLPEIVAGVRELAIADCVLDGEVAALDAAGRTSFQLLQNAFGGGRRPPLAYFVFDLTSLDGQDLTGWPLEERKAVLEGLVAAGRSATVFYAAHVIGDGERVFQAACAAGLEGIVSKRRDAPYEVGRKPTWVKVKCSLRQEFVVCGVLDRINSGGRDVGALVLGLHEGGELVYAGKVGTGYTQKSARELRDRLRPLEQAACPFPRRPPGFVGRDTHWVRPELVCEVSFTEFTGSGQVRHPSFLGLRLDKRATEVVRERPASSTATSSTERPQLRGVGISHPDRVLFPRLGVTKLELRRYYDAVSPWMVPQLAGRPLTLLRCDPDISRCVFLRHGKAWGPGELRRVRIQEKKKVGEYLVADTPAALIALAQMGIVEVHTWNSTVDHVELPDRIVIDLDPGPQVRWAEVVAGARLVRAVLESLGLRAWLKTTGGAGLHVVVPLAPTHDWSACLGFARGLCEAIEREAPRRYTTAMPKQGRERKILLDYLRNNRTNTSVAAYSVRARPAATVSMPISWEELDDGRLRSDRFSLRDVPTRLQSRADPWSDYASHDQELEPRAIAAVRRLTPSAASNPLPASNSRGPHASPRHPGP